MSTSRSKTGSSSSKKRSPRRRTTGSVPAVSPPSSASGKAMSPTASQERSRAIVEKGESMARELSAKRKKQKKRRAAEQRAEKRPTPPANLLVDDATEVDQLPAHVRTAPSDISRTAEIKRPLSTLDLLAIELDQFTKESIAAVRKMDAGERVALLSSLCMFAGCFLPWVSTSHQAGQLGFFAGGFFHSLIAVVGVRLAFLRHRPGKKKKRQSQREAIEKRHALWLVLLGMLSTVIGAVLLVLWGLQKSVWFGVDFHAGLYWTLAWGTGLSYGGYACFRRFR